MGLTDILIIYLAAGSPFAVYRYMERPHGGGLAVLYAFHAWLLWPVGAFRTLVAAIQEKDKRRIGPADQISSQKDEHLMTCIKRIFREHQDLDREHRELFERYVGLSLALSADGGDGELEIFRVVGRRDGAVGAACLGRRNAARLRRHHKEASAQLVAAAETLANEAISARLAELAGLAGDRETAAVIANRLAEGVNVVTAESIWIPRQEFLEM
jgi:hypothetical protein